MTYSASAGTRMSLVMHFTTASGNANLALPVAVMVVMVIATWFLLRRTTTGRQLYAMGDNPEAGPDLVDLLPAGQVPPGFLPVLRAYEAECRRVPVEVLADGTDAVLRRGPHRRRAEARRPDR